MNENKIIFETEESSSPAYIAFAAILMALAFLLFLFGTANPGIA